MTSFSYLLENKQHRVKEQASGSPLRVSSTDVEVFNWILQLRAIKTRALPMIKSATLARISLTNLKNKLLIKQFRERNR